MKIDREGTTHREVEGRKKSCVEIVCGCCSRGGCCRILPPKIICNSDGQPIRINLLYALTGVCTSAGGIYDTIPEELLKAGISVDEAEEWLIRRLKLVSKTRNPCIQDLAFCLFIWIPLFCFTPFFCQRNRDHIYQWNAELKKWQDEFNNEVLARKGLFVKTRSHCSASYDSDGKNRRTEHWIAIALTPEESEKLRVEPHLTGDIENNERWCNGINEGDLCMHPY